MYLITRLRFQYLGFLGGLCFFLVIVGKMLASLGVGKAHLLPFRNSCLDFGCPVGLGHTEHRLSRPDPYPLNPLILCIGSDGRFNDLIEKKC